MNKNIKSILVTGSEGFIGKHLVSKLNSLGINVIRYDRKLSKEITDIKSLSDVDCVIHLAAQSSVANDNVSQITKDNINAFKYLCNLSVEYSVRFIYASSAVAYDNNITSAYGLSKKFNEEYASVFSNTCGLRFYNVYGNNARPDTLFGKLLTANEITLVNNGNNKRYFTYIDDIISGILYAIDNPSKLYAIHNTELNSLNEIALEVKKYRDIKINYLDQLEKIDLEVQELDPSVPNIPLDYIKLQDGVKKIFI